MYNWLIFLHILFALLFMLAHGAQAAAMLKFRTEPDPERSLTFFNIVPDATMIRILTAAMGIAGLLAALITDWWRQGWVWASLAVFLIISYVMYKFGGGYFGLIQDAATRAVDARKTNTNAEAALKEYNQVRNSARPMMVSVVGIAGLAIILWLMRFKPF